MNAVWGQLRRSLTVIRQAPVATRVDGDPGRAKVLRRRALLNQAQGMLMLVYGIDETTARDLLNVISRTHDVDLRLLVHRITQDLSRPSRLTRDTRAALHERVLAAYERA